MSGLSGLRSGLRSGLPGHAPDMSGRFDGHHLQATLSNVCEKGGCIQACPAAQVAASEDQSCAWPSPACEPDD